MLAVAGLGVTLLLILATFPLSGHLALPYRARSVCYGNLRRNGVVWRGLSRL